jgi:RHS repeat-associated protein
MMRRALAWMVLTLASVAMSAMAQTVVYFHTDVLGSIVAVTDESRSVVERREYEPFGLQLTPAIKDGPGYTGHVQDEATGLTYMQQRYYDPAIGRFMSVDPVEANAHTGANFNRYKYASNNPYSFRDPDGMQECRSCEVGYGAAASLMLSPEQRRIWESGERAATTAGSGAEEGAALMDAAKNFFADPQISKE